MKDENKTKVELIKELKLLREEREKGVFEDITELKQAEQSLQESEKKFRELFNYMSSGVAVYEAKDDGEDFIFRNFNQAAEKIEKVKKEDIIGKSVLQVFPGVKDFGLFKVFQEVYHTGKPQYFPISLYKDQRITGWRENYIYKLPSGEIVAVYDDITERKKAEKELKDSEERLKILFDYAPDAYYISDLKGKFIDGNKAAERLIGYKREELIGKSFLKLKLLSLADLPKAVKALANNLRGLPTGPDEFVLNRKDNSKVMVEISIYPVKIKGKTLVLGIARDSTERKRAEEELRESEKKWRSLVSVLPDYVSLLDLEGRFLFLNHYAEGFTEKEVIGSSVYQYFSTQSKEIFAKEIAECQNTGKIRKFEHSAMGDHGIMREYENYLVPLFEKNKVTNIMDISRDITERKRAEEEIEELAKFPSENPYPVLRISKDGTVLYHNLPSELLLEHWHYQEGKPLQGKWFQFVLDALDDDDIKTVEAEIGDKVIFLTFAPIVEKDFVNVYGLDITERKTMEERERHFKQVLLAIRKVNQLIVQETDSERLIDQTCQILIETLGYYNDWIVLFDEDKKVISIKASGFIDGYNLFEEQLKQGKYPHCIKKAFQGKGTIIINSASDSCPDCPLYSGHAGRAALCGRIQHGDKLYGMLSVSIPREYANLEETLKLFIELAGDLGLALYKIALEEKHKQAEEEMEKLAKFPAENPYPVLRIYKDGTVLYHNHPSESLLEHWNYKEGEPLQSRWFQCVLDALKDDDIKTVETEIGDKVIFLTFAPIIERDFVNVYGLDITKRKKMEEREHHFKQVILAIRKVNQLIVSEADPEHLIDQACQILTETLGYYNAWIALLDEGGKVTSTAASGFDDSYNLFEEQLKQGKYPHCIKKAFQGKGTLVINSASDSCPDCPLYSGHVGRAGLSSRIQYGDKLYGLLSVSIPREYANLEETSKLFIELAGDLGLALYKIALEEEHKQAEELLRTEQQRLHNVLEVMPMMVCLLTPDYHVPFANRAFREKFGESNGRHCYEYCFGKKEPCDFCESYEVLKTGKPHRWEVTSPDGATEIEAYDFPFTDVDGLPMILEVDVDITERRQAQKALQKAHDQLEDKVVKRTKELQKANLKLQELDQLKTMFIASMSHELRTPLTLIIGFTDIILQEISGEINKEQRKQFTLVKKNANHLLALINDVLDINKIEASKVKIIIEEFDLSALAQEIKDNFRIAADKKGLELSLEVPPLLLIKGEERRTKQILVNLMSNALKFTARGEIKIKIATKDQMVEIAVQDTGIGIRRREDMDKLFKPFSRISGPGKLGEGTGLGLYLSKKNAHLLGGDIIAESELGKGSVFTLILPLKYKETKA